MSQRKSRQQLIQTLIRGSLNYNTITQFRDIEKEIGELGKCARVQPLHRQRLLQIIHAGRSLDTCLSLILTANRIAPKHGIGGMLNQMKSLDPNVKGYLDHSTAAAFKITIADRRNIYAHRAGRFPSSTAEVDRFVGEVHACLAIIL